jgi:hypothetical protein
MLELPENSEEAVSLLMAIARLNGSNLDFKRVTTWLEQNSNKLASVNKEEKEDINLRWNQGAMQLIDNFLNVCTRARALVEKYRGDT